MVLQTPESDPKSELRKRLIAVRNGLPPQEREQLDGRICTRLRHVVEERGDRHVAAFAAFNGEPDLMPALEALHRNDKLIYLPVVRERQMVFRRWIPGQAMAHNRFGIPEPADGAECSPERLDLVLMPLVAFSASGTRLGMGAGFYDRIFAFRREQVEAPPRLLGVAYAVQAVEALPTDDWDVPLDGIVTEEGLRWFP